MSSALDFLGNLRGRGVGFALFWGVEGCNLEEQGTGNELEGRAGGFGEGAGLGFDGRFWHEKRP